MTMIKERANRITNWFIYDIPAFKVKKAYIPSGPGAFKELVCLNASKISSDLNYILEDE